MDGGLRGCICKRVGSYNLLEPSHDSDSQRVEYGTNVFMIGLRRAEELADAAALDHTE